MGCRASVTIVGPDDPAVLHRMHVVAEWRLRELEARWSRFLPDSEITALAHAEGRPVVVSTSTRTLVRHLVDAWEATGGVFDPTLLPALVAQGYAASFTDPAHVTDLAAPQNPHHPDHSQRPTRYDPTAIEIDEDAGTVRLPTGGTLDAGGLGKGLAADIVVAELLDRGADGAMVEIGGDLRVAGSPPSGPGWRIDVEDPLAAEGAAPASAHAPPLAVVALSDGGVATSSRMLRRWTGEDGRPRHHLLDPSTGAPTDPDLGATSVVAATVVTATGAWSEAFAKLPFVLGPTDGVRRLEDESVAALVVLADGTLLTTRPWADVAPSGEPA